LDGEKKGGKTTNLREKEKGGEKREESEITYLRTGGIGGDDGIAQGEKGSPGVLTIRQGGRGGAPASAGRGKKPDLGSLESPWEEKKGGENAAPAGQ